ncbi:MAG: UDP-N-acetylmuramoyl-L-alanine--D-glutamate ligase [Candidatus Omnitrophota bacterium]|jgi:UDP-N-acetylmuramoylalanine--D-glutamate ligase|nr:MAG: UDP-N-acetylmuramoyl-L-alanine--D-glutamate ligase [Candidatus Omnitrophota bacterium]
MVNTIFFKDKIITIVGFARSGLACANLLWELGSRVSVTDSADNAVLRKNYQNLKSKEIKVELGRHTIDFIRGRDLIVVSPGVDDSSPALKWAKELSIPVISEIELASRLCPGTIIAVTGSNGKTTVTTLIGKVLQANSKKAFVCGNIGTPFTLEVKKIKEGDFAVVEVSSFQLEKIDTFKPKVAVILNITPNHLDRYSSMDEYITAKKRIFKNQDKSDYLVLNGKDEVLNKVSVQAQSKVMFFSESADFNPNQEAVMAVASVFGINRDVCKSVFKEFRGIEHRMEFVKEISGVKFINDSKATTVDSALWAIKNIKEPIILIAGGKDKGVDYKVMLPGSNGKVKEVILIGEAKEKIRKALKGFLPLDDALTLDEAVNKAFVKARKGDCVLLSPMCASFDMFLNYEERGKAFKHAVASLSAK